MVPRATSGILLTVVITTSKFKILSVYLPSQICIPDIYVLGQEFCGWYGNTHISFESEREEVLGILTSSLHGLILSFFLGGGVTTLFFSLSG